MSSLNWLALTGLWLFGYAVLLAILEWDYRSATTNLDDPE